MQHVSMCLSIFSNVDLSSKIRPHKRIELIFSVSIVKYKQLKYLKCNRHKKIIKQECIPVRCVPPACCPYLPVCTARGGGVSGPRKCTCWGGICTWGCTCPGSVPVQGCTCWGCTWQGVYLMGGVPGGRVPAEGTPLCEQNDRQVQKYYLRLRAVIIF